MTADRTPATWRRFVAVGDSFTEGIDDPDHTGRHHPGRHLGWADRLAEQLAAHNAELEYANLAIRGRKLPAIIEEQLPAALSLEPDLVSIVGGVNDCLRPQWDPYSAAELYEAGVAVARGTGADVILMTFGQSGERSRAMGLIDGRLATFREMVLDIGQRHECFVVDFWHESLFTDPRFWSDDRLHLNDLGHDRVAAATLETLGLPASDWREPLAADDGRSLLSAARNDLEWTVRHLAPWLARRIRGISSGDGVEPKRAVPLPIATQHSDRAG